ncbi:hypothetical protein [Lactobacillus sp. B4026]|uniref:hypothetical protein n=1 Tax=Lactobacillus sp. B4026 TaxID=2818035 RepID=UPI00226B74C6|nr:hypothetical protein [Lactobacillus sp. B4026]MCX8736345.1 hypothetical protein [Lactobacillus sp. B4026]
MSLLAVSSLAVAGVATVQADAQDNPTFETFGAKRTAVKSLPRRLLIINKK